MQIILPILVFAFLSVSAIILVDGNPLKDLKLLGASYDMWATPRADRSIKTIPFIMKDGKIYKNTLLM